MWRDALARRRPLALPADLWRLLRLPPRRRRCLPTAATIHRTATRRDTPLHSNAHWWLHNIAHWMDAQRHKRRRPRPDTRDAADGRLSSACLWLPALRWLGRRGGCVFVCACSLFSHCVAIARLALTQWPIASQSASSRPSPSPARRSSHAVFRSNAPPCPAPRTRAPSGLARADPQRGDACSRGTSTSDAIRHPQTQPQRSRQPAPQR